MAFAPPLGNRPSLVKTALVVDADPQVEAVLRSALNAKGWSIRHASDNATALALAEAIPCDLILTSEKTSGKEDVELLRKIRRVRPHTRLIILTDQTTPGDVIAAMRARAFSYFSKPLSLESLADMIQSAAEGPCWDEGIEVLSATPSWICLAASCDPRTAERLVQFINEIADQIRHTALANPPEDPLRHAVYRETQGLRPGGYGVLLARELVDELIYDEKGNDVLLIKYLDLAHGSKLAEGKAQGA
jgi:DNA-binding NarL/FixJ family response regulator